MESAKSSVVLVDARNFIFRAHFSHRNLSSRGRPTSVLYGGLSMLLMLASRFPNAAIAFVWDGGGETWRHRLSNGVYKANRVMTAETKEVIDQIPLFEEVLAMIGIRSFKVPGLEGDDLIGILSRSAMEAPDVDRVFICSTDRDYYQLLVKDKRLQIKKFDTVKNTELFGPQNVRDEFGVGPEEWTKFRALTGDKGDNIIQARKGIGPKTALGMLQLGVNPSKEKFTQIPGTAQIQFADLRQLWPQIYQNYIMSKIVEDSRADCLSDDIRAQLSLRYFGREPTLGMEQFSRHIEGKVQTAYDKVVDILGDYELQEIIGRRHELFKLP